MQYWSIQTTTLTIGRGSITVQLTSCLICLDLAALLMLNEPQFYLFGQLQSSQTGGQPCSDASPYKVSENSLSSYWYLCLCLNTLNIKGGPLTIIDSCTMSFNLVLNPDFSRWAISQRQEILGMNSFVNKRRRKSMINRLFPLKAHSHELCFGACGCSGMLRCEKSEKFPIYHTITFCHSCTRQTQLVWIILWLWMFWSSLDV